MPLHSGKSPDRTKDGPRFAGRGFRLEKADGKCPFYTGWNAASDSLRAALRAVARWTPAAAGVRGRLAGKRGALPPLANHPRRGCSRVPATANKFVHILWKNLFAITSRRISFAPAPGVGGWRCMAYAYCSREGDAPAGCRAGAHCASLRRIVDSVPIPGCSGVAANPLPVVMAIGWQTEGVTYSYARSAS